jgi:4-oxalocrotonate tautomerase
MDPRFAEIATALADYFDGLYDGDLDKLRRVFHPKAHLYSATEGPLTDLPLDDYLALVAGRAAPASQGAPRYDRIVSRSSWRSRRAISPTS